MTARRVTASIALLVLAAARPMLSQRATSDVRSWLAPLALIGSEAEDRIRRAQLRGASSTGWLIRTPMTLSSDTLGRRHLLPWCELRAAASTPTLDVAMNSALPFERNDHGLWSGRGASLYATGGIRAACGRVRVNLVPAVWYAQNRNFALIAAQRPERSGFAHPFHSDAGSSADIPIRFGSQPLLVLEPGQSAIEVDAGPVTVGAGFESQWWGPGIRNALLMSNHAAGIPHAFVRTRAPVATPIGRVEARWLVGALSESPFFDFDENNDLRSIAGLIVAVHTAADSNLAIGAARVVYAPIGGIGALPARFLDPVGRWGESADLRKATSGRAAEQMTALFARWIFPPAGFEVFTEWTRLVLPGSLTSLLAAPEHSQGYTVGLQWLSPRAGRSIRVQAEFTQLEQLVVRRDSAPPQFYASPVVGQGFTQRGQVIGATIGPGSSSQWLAVDYLLGDRRLGAFLGRIRWDNDSYYSRPTSFSRFAHDVSVYGGVRVGFVARMLDVTAELLRERRMNYLFQNSFTGFAEDDSFDVGNVSLRITIGPRARSRD